MLISDLVQGVRDKLAGRTDVAAKAPKWIKKAIQDITESYPFVELEAYGSPFTLTVGQRNYPLTIIPPDNTLGGRHICGTTNNGVDIALDYPTDIRFFELYLDYPTNSRTVKIDIREPGVVVPLSRIQGIPKYCCRFGQEVIFGFCPDRPYTVIMYYQKRHLFLTDVGNQKLADSPILMPEDWLEILEYAAAEKGAMELRLPDYVTLYHTLLHGDPEKPTELGLIKAKVSQHAKDKVKNTGQLTPIVSQY